MKLRTPLLLLFVILSYDLSLLAGELIRWTYGLDINTPLQVIDRINVEVDVVDFLKNDFKANAPENAVLSELVLNRVYFNPESNTRVYLFNLLYVEDVGYIYVVDKKDSILSKHVYSYWEDRGKGREPLFLRKLDG